MDNGINTAKKFIKSKFQKTIYHLKKLIMTVNAYIEMDAKTGLYVAIVPGISGAHTQAETLDELRENLTEVLELCLEEM